MKTITFDTAVDPCPHCAGTGLCLHGTITSNHSHQWLDCDDCGKGIPAVVAADFDDATHRPVCSHCNGTGVARSARRAAACAR
ncbi:MAG TPA: hypothetical protein VNZ64_14495 [Candidatus Acidoferrum sp.]|nr:hypothetical protein [Candidatus Acidoferrum sp.]